VTFRDRGEVVRRERRDRAHGGGSVEREPTEEMVAFRE
jgi:hypothetical protein